MHYHGWGSHGRPHGARLGVPPPRRVSVRMAAGSGVQAPPGPGLAILGIVNAGMGFGMLVQIEELGKLRTQLEAKVSTSDLSATRDEVIKELKNEVAKANNKAQHEIVQELKNEFASNTKVYDKISQELATINNKVNDVHADVVHMSALQLGGSGMRSRVYVYAPVQRRR